MAIINKHNKEHDLGEHSWKMGINQFSDLTHDEFMEMNTLKLPESSQSRVRNKLPSMAVADEIDWRDSVSVMPIYCPFFTMEIRFHLNIFLLLPCRDVSPL